jgi:hypothetical protein
VKKNTTPEEILKAIQDSDLEALKAIKERIGRDRWLNQFGGKSVPVSAWVDPEYNPEAFVKC